MSEPEFLPEWYVRKLRRQSARATWVRRGAALTAAAALCMVLARGRFAPNSAAANSPFTSAASSAERSRRKVPAAAGYALDALDALRDALPADVTVSSLAVSSDGDSTTLNLRCAAVGPEAADRFKESLRRNPAFRDVQVLPQRNSDSFQVRISSAAGNPEQ